MPLPPLDLQQLLTKLLQSCPTLCNPIDGSPPGSPVPGILQEEHWSRLPFPSQCMKVKSESEVAQSCLTLHDPKECSLPGCSIHGISRQEYWSGLPLPSPAELSAKILSRPLIGKKAFRSPNKLHLSFCLWKPCQYLFCSFAFSSRINSESRRRFPSPKGTRAHSGPPERSVGRRQDCPGHHGLASPELKR